MAAYLRTGALLAVLLALAGCNSETEVVVVDCLGPDLGLDGAWYGAMEDDSGALFTLEWEICGERIVRESVGGFASGVSGRLWPAGPGTWHGTLSDGTQLRVLADGARRHLVMVNDVFEFAVLERGAAGLPGYLFSDLDGHWSGRHAWLDWAPDVVDSAWMLCGTGRCDAAEANGVSTTYWFDVLDADFGMYRGEFADSLGQAGIAGALMSPDLLFLGTYACPADFRGPDDCTFGALHFD
jgi:hypothetical protein